MTRPSHPQSPSSAENLRDARLAHALQHMPDAHMQPTAQTRHAVLQEALRVANTPSPTEKRRWWHAWLGQPGQRVPWSAALASLAIVGFITVLWYGQDVPDAALPSAPAAPAPQASPAVAQADAETVFPATGSASKTKPAELAKDARPQAREAEALGAIERAAPRPAPAMAAAPASDKALVDVSPILTITLGDVTRSVAPEKAQALLNLLRGLPYAAVPDVTHREASNADLVVEIAGQERWVIAPDAVRYLPLTARAKGGSSDITPAQYADLRRLAMEPEVQP